MRTLFSCPELALQIEGFDTHEYQVRERVHVRYKHHLVSLIVEAVIEHDDLREVQLRPAVSGDSYGAHLPNRSPAKRIDPDWIDRFCDAIEGGD